MPAPRRSLERLHRDEARVAGAPDVGALLERDIAARPVERARALVLLRIARRPEGLDLQEANAVGAQVGFHAREQLLPNPVTVEVAPDREQLDLDREVVVPAQ